MRFFYLACGFFSLGLAISGIFLPLLPTTPLLLLSAFCFARSSEKFYIWLLEHPYLGKTIKEWKEHGIINRKAKISAIIMIVLTFALSFALNLSATILIIQLLILSAVSIFILTRPDRKRTE